MDICCNFVVFELGSLGGRQFTSVCLWIAIDRSSYLF
nr:MAG TPA: hypothetical protein [Caudoviricetes sp.]